MTNEEVIEHIKNSPRSKVIRIDVPEIVHQATPDELESLVKTFAPKDK